MKKLNETIVVDDRQSWPGDRDRRISPCVGCGTAFEGGKHRSMCRLCSPVPELLQLDYAAIEQRVLASFGVIPWDEAPEWARFAYSAGWAVTWLENAPVQIIHDDIVVDGRTKSFFPEPGAVPAVGLVKRPEAYR